MLELVLFACFAIALFTFILRVNHNDREEVVATALETQRLEEGLLRDLEKAEGDYQNALQGNDRILAENLGKAYYKNKTEYEYREAATYLYYDTGNLAKDEQLRIKNEVELKNSQLMQDISAKNEQALAHDLKAMRD
ncbi:MAG: hypothetical protein WAT36_02455 [Chromatiaceae bacterium]